MSHTLRRRGVQRTCESELYRALAQVKARLSARDFQALCMMLALLALGVADGQKKGGRR